MVCEHGIDDAASLVCTLKEHASVVKRYGELA